jgi:enoyl-CoA hydratase
MSPSSPFSIERLSDGIALLSLDNPPANALTVSMRESIAETWTALRDDDTVGVVVVTGRGRHFCAGLDLVELTGDLDDETAPEERHRRVDRLRWDPRSAGLLKPVIGAINGSCLAGGMYLAQMCDLRVASEDAVFGVPEGRWAFPASFMWELARQFPACVVLEMLLLPERQLSAQRMYSLGFLNAVVPSAEVLDAALEMARRVLDGDAATARVHKQLVHEVLYADGELMNERVWQIVRGLYDLESQRNRLARFSSSRSKREDLGGPARRAGTGRAPT